MFNRVLIANRGEIAARIAATLQQMGVTAVGVYSEADRAAYHVSCMDEAYPLEGKTAAESYLRVDKIIDIAKRHKIEAVHPGYGFLSENAAFAQGCVDAEVFFIGPKPEVIRKLGDKVNARQLMAEAGVPVVPGWSGGEKDDAAQFEREAEKIGYPVLLKAAAGGGGKGMRVVRSRREMAESMESCRREAGAAFGNSRVFMEKYLPKPRHVEFQIFGDTHGNAVHMFERECSIQRRHQKIIEETPSPALTPSLRDRMGDAAVKAAKAAGYSNAGTVEFLVDDAGNFYFLEVNTRLQVEHAITEMTLGLDLVRLQLEIASGQKLPMSQEQLRPTGHSMECRIYAEDPDRQFLPSAGVVERFLPPVGPCIRIDAGVTEGSAVSVHYDPQLAKVIVWGHSRNESRARMLWALQRFVVLGLQTNLEFLQAVLDHPEFRAGRLHTHFLEVHAMPRADRTTPDEALIAAALAASNGTGRRDAGRDRSNGGVATANPWQSLSNWRSA